MSQELNTLLPLGKELKIRDENLTIKPFKLGELPKVFKAIDPISKALFDSISKSGNQVEMITGLVANGGENLIDLMVIGSKKSREWVEDLELDEGIELFGAILEVNASFFVQKVLPNLNKKMEAVQAGQTS